MSPAHWDTLPDHLRDRATVRKPKNARISSGQFRCVACGNVETKWAAAERHADREHHPRIECEPKEAG